LRADATLSDYKRRALLSQLGPFDPIFERAGINPGEAVFLLFYERARFEEQITRIDPDKHPLAALLAKAMLPNGVHIFDGLLEDDELHPVSAVGSIRNLSSDQLKECRAYLSMIPSGLAFGQLFIGLFAIAVDLEKKHQIDVAYSAAYRSIQRWPWMIFSFAMVANIMYHWKLKNFSSSH
jgi:hypothetical protein